MAAYQRLTVYTESNGLYLYGEQAETLARLRPGGSLDTLPTGEKRLRVYEPDNDEMRAYLNQRGYSLVIRKTGRGARVRPGSPALGRSPITEPKAAKAEKKPATDFDSVVKDAIKRNANGSGFARISAIRRDVAQRTGLTPAQVDQRLRELRDRGDANGAPFALQFEPDEEGMHRKDRRPLRWGGEDFDYIAVVTTSEQQRRIDHERQTRIDRERGEVFKQHGMKPPKPKKPKAAAAPRRAITTHPLPASAAPKLPDPRTMSDDALYKESLRLYDLVMSPPRERSHLLDDTPAKQRYRALGEEIKRRKLAKAAKPAAKPKKAAPRQAPATRPLPKTLLPDRGPTPVPIRTGTAEEYNAYENFDPDRLAWEYGKAQLPRVLVRGTQRDLYEAVRITKERHPGTKPRGTSKAALIEYIASHASEERGKPKPKPQPPVRVITTSAEDAPRGLFGRFGRKKRGR